MGALRKSGNGVGGKADHGELETDIRVGKGCGRVPIGWEDRPNPSCV